jgi:LysR family transcriptional regulator, low CO2-responsive transcriptional regulator
MIIDADRLRGFVAFADHLSFTAAARALHLTQPALFTQIKKLGEELGVALYLRHGRRLELTTEGAAIARFGREQAARTAAFLDELRFGKSRQPVVLAAGEGSFLYLLGEAISTFVKSKAAPLSLLTRDREGTIAALRGGVAHLGVASLSSVPPDLDGETIAVAGALAVLPPKHALAKKRSLRPKDLAGERLILPPRGRPHRETIEAALAEANVGVEVAVEAHGWETMLSFVRLGLGIAIVNDHVRVPKKLAARRLHGVPPRTYQLLYRGALEHQGAAELAATIRRAKKR